MKQSRPKSLQELFLGRFSRKQTPKSEEEFWVLDDISFEVYQGETLSLIGANGAGKSTLFKLLTHIVKPTRGTITIHGRVSALLELGTSFHPDLTGRENIYLGATLAGLSRSDVEGDIQHIIDFASIGRFIDVPVRHYSSGMFVRLGFALATHVHPDILVVDEVLAVGDASFQKRCFKKIREIRNRGVTVLLVSHNMSVVQSISDRVLWLKGGTIQDVGDPDTIIQEYLTDQRNQDTQREKSASVDPHQEDKIVTIESVEFFNGSGNQLSILETGKKATIRINYVAHEPVEKPVFGLAIYGQDGVHINGPNTGTSGFTIDYIQGRGMVEYQMDFLPLLGGTYSVTVGIFDKTTLITYDFLDSAFRFTVEQNNVREMHGLVYVPAQWNHIQK